MIQYTVTHKVEGYRGQVTFYHVDPASLAAGTPLGRWILATDLCYIDILPSSEGFFSSSNISQSPYRVPHTTDIIR